MKKFLSLFLAAATALVASAQAKYVFFFIGDGMGMGHVNAAETYNRDVLGNETPLLMLTFPVASQSRTYSASSPVTDSAAAGTALSTGSKTVNYRLGMAPDSTNVYSISRDFIEAGRAVGIATSVAGDDATPGAFYGHGLSRSDVLDIAPGAIGSGVAFLAGGSFKILDAAGDAGEKWLGGMKADGYTAVKGRRAYDALSAKQKKKVLMMAETDYWDQIGYTIDSIPGALTLPEITEACLQTVQTADKGEGFFMMVEGGNIDWAAHANDAGTVIKEILNFQQAIGVAYDFYLAHPEETLIIITADHDTGGMALGRADNHRNVHLEYIDAQRQSKDRFADLCRERKAGGKELSWPEMQQYLRDMLGFWSVIPLTDEETRALEETFDATFITREAADSKTLYNDFNAFTAKVYDIQNHHIGTGWPSDNHTGNFVPVYAIGKGAELFTGNLDNTLIPELIRRAAFGK
ncbi:MAG: alkaline phosphatase [Muribaculaceae bacterium]|nr:alkaline phosphatase [Muribaculaceae bacterium]